MPLPYAPPPKESKVYRDLKNLKVADVTGTQLISLKDGVYAQGVDGAEDEMRRLKLLGEVSNQQSSSGPISMEIVQTTITGTSYNDIKPTESGIYQLQAIGAVMSNMSGTSKWGLYYGTDADQDLLQWYYMTTTDSTVIFTSDANFYEFPMYYSKDCWLTVREYGSGTYDSGVITVVFTKVR